MKYRFITFLAITLSIAAPGNTVAQSSSGNSLLWQISGDKLKKPSYLYGTIHMLCPQDFRISETLKQVFSASEKIYLELDMDDPSMNMKMLQLSLLKGKKLSDFFNEKDYARLNDFFRDSIGMPLALFSSLKPFALLSLIYMKSMPCGQQESYELNFANMSKAEHKEMLGLETIEDQIGVFDQMPDSMQAKMIMESINQFGQQQNESLKMVEFYKNQQLDSLYRMIVESPDISGSEDALIFNRNRKWIPVMEDSMNKGSIFFAVGAGHLAGPGGLISLLRQKGYELKPIVQ